MIQESNGKISKAGSVDQAGRLMGQWRPRLTAQSLDDGRINMGRKEPTGFVLVENRRINCDMIVNKACIF